MAALRFLRLVADAFGTPTSELELVVSATGEARKQALQGMFKAAFDQMFTSDVDIARATYGQLESVFTKVYKLQGATRRKALTFFLHGCEYCGIPVSTHITTRAKQQSTSGKVVSPRPRRTTSTSTGMAPDGISPRQTKNPTSQQIVASSANTKTVQLLSGGSVTLTVEAGWFDVSDVDRAFVHTLVDALNNYQHSHENREGEDEEGEDSEAEDEENY